MDVGDAAVCDCFLIDDEPLTGGALILLSLWSFASCNVGNDGDDGGGSNAFMDVPWKCLVQLVLPFVSTLAVLLLWLLVFVVGLFLPELTAEVAAGFAVMGGAVVGVVVITPWILGMWSVSDVAGLFVAKHSRSKQIRMQAILLNYRGPEQKQKCP